MVYLDYSATTPVNEEVLDTYVKVVNKYIGNPNSLHKLGIEAKNLIDASTAQIKDILKAQNMEVIYTSGASEANNLAVKGIALKYQNRGKHIITTELEHSSVLEPIKYLESLGFEISYVKLDSNGLVDLDDLKRLMRNDTILVSIACVNSEVGVIQSLAEISKIVREYPKCYLHSDITQCIGKIEVDLSLLDLASFSGQKFYGMKGIGCLLKKENIVIEPLIHGGKSTTSYRSGTPALALIVSLAKALRLAYNDFSAKYARVSYLNKYLISKLKKLDVTINSNSYCVPHIVNISLHGIKSETMLHALEQDDIYISTQTACSLGNYSRSVFSVSGDMDKAMHSMRISISYLTTKEEIDKFIISLQKNIEHLNFEK
ncbi:MAG: cysteine desulfurase family protein [bacterium]|nr:cysteine desulfurase family protein [bacterium]